MTERHQTGIGGGRGPDVILDRATAVRQADVVESQVVPGVCSQDHDESGLSQAAEAGRMWTVA